MITAHVITIYAHWDLRPRWWLQASTSKWVRVSSLLLRFTRSGLAISCAFSAYHSLYVINWFWKKREEKTFLLTYSLTQVKRQTSFQWWTYWSLMGAMKLEAKKTLSCNNIAIFFEYLRYTVHITFVRILTPGWGTKCSKNGDHDHSRY